MTTLVNYESRELHTLIEKMKVKVHDEVYNKLNEGLDRPKYYPEFIEVYVRVLTPEGRNVNLKDIVISSVDISPEETKVYKSHSKSLCGEMVNVIIVLIAKHIYYTKPDIVNLGETSRTFNSHEELLKFITDTHLKLHHLSDDSDISVSLFDKNTRMELFEVFRNLNNKDSSIPSLTEDEFTTLRGYSELSRDVKDRVDNALYPLTVVKEDIWLINSAGWYNIYVDKQEFIDEHLSTDEWSNTIQTMLN